MSRMGLPEGGEERPTMKWYKLSYVMHEPSEDTEDKYMAEIPALPGM